jgi:hypothetical protein
LESANLPTSVFLEICYFNKSSTETYTKPYLLQSFLATALLFELYPEDIKILAGLFGRFAFILNLRRRAIFSKIYSLLLLLQSISK